MPVYPATIAGRDNSNTAIAETMPDHQHIADEYTEGAGHYDRRWQRYNAASCAGTLRALAKPFSIPGCNSPDISLLDVACGTGLLLEQCHRHVPAAALSGCDLSSGMLEQARQRVGSAAALFHADAQQLPFDNDRFDIAVCNSALQHFNDPAAALREIFRVLRPGGQFVMTAWAADTLLARMHYGWLRWRNPFVRQVLCSDGYTRLLKGAGFKLLNNERYSAGILWLLVTLHASKPL